jgi:hypothetical protein
VIHPSRRSAPAPSGLTSPSRYSTNGGPTGKLRARGARGTGTGRTLPVHPGHLLGAQSAGRHRGPCTGSFRSLPVSLARPLGENGETTDPTTDYRGSSLCLARSASHSVPPSLRPVRLSRQSRIGRKLSDADGILFVDSSFHCGHVD